MYVSRWLNILKKLVVVEGQFLYLILRMSLFRFPNQKFQLSKQKRFRISWEHSHFNKKVTQNKSPLEIGRVKLGRNGFLI